MERKYKYNAFISYRHISPDKEIADKLQKKLESYRPPKALLKGQPFDGWHVFRDETELPISSNLGSDITTALENSEFLIVICSKTTGQSRWCMQEIEYFKRLHNGSNTNIVTLVADGNPEDVFPPALCNELIPVTDEFGNTTYQNRVVEPLAANVAGQSLKQSLKKLNTEFLRVAAPLLGCGYNDLYNREHRKKVRKLLTIGGIALIALLLFAIYTSIMLWRISTQKTQLAKANAANLGIISESLWSTGDGVGAIETALSALPNEDNPDQPVVPSVVRTLANETGAYRTESFLPVARLSCNDHVINLGYAGGGSSVVAQTSLGIYFWDSKTGALKKEYSADTFGGSSAGITVFFDDTGLYENLGAYNYAAGVYIRDADNYVGGFRRNRSQPTSLAGGDVLIKSTHGIYKLSGETGELLWSTELDNFTHADVTEATIILSQSTYDSTAKTGSLVTVLNRTTGAVLSRLTLPDPDIGSGILSYWCDVTANKGYYYAYDGQSHRTVSSFDISGDLLTNKTVLYTSASDPLSSGHDFTQVDRVQLVGNDLYLVKTHWDSLQYYYVTQILVFDAAGQKKWDFSFQSELYGDHIRLAVFDKALCNNYCDILAVVKGDHIQLINNETGAGIAAYKLDDVAKSSYYSRDGFFTVITAGSNEVVVPVRKLPSQAAAQANSSVFLLHKFLSPYALYACHGHSYAVAGKSSNEVYLYSDVENADFRDLYTGTETIKRVRLNPAQTHMAIEHYKAVYLYDLSSGQLCELVKSDSYLQDSQFISNDLYAVVIDQRLDVYDVHTKQVVFTKQGNLRSLILNGDSKYIFPTGGALAICESSEEVSIITDWDVCIPWSPAAGRVKGEVPYITALYPSDRSGKLLACVRFGFDAGNALEVYDIATHTAVPLAVDIPTDTDATLDIRCVSWLERGDILMAFSDGTVRCFDADTGTCRYQFSPNTPTVVSLVPLNSETLLGLLCSDSVLYKVRVSDGAVLDQVDLDNEEVKSANDLDLTRSVLIPERSLLLLSGWSTDPTLGRAYAIDTDTFDIVYDIEGYEDYYPQADALIVKEYGVAGQCPLYTVTQLTQKARRGITAS